MEQEKINSEITIERENEQVKPQEISCNENAMEKKKISLKKVILFIILGMLGSIALLAAGLPLYGNYLASKEFPQKEQVILATQPNGQKMLIVYQPSSNSGITEEVAYKIAQGASEKGTEVKLMRPRSDAPASINDYDVIVFGTPWYFQPSSELIKFMQKNENYSGKKVCLFITCGGQDDPKMFEVMEKHLKDANIVGRELFHVEKEKHEAIFKNALDLGKKIGER